jgi:thioredoxin 1
MTNALRSLLAAALVSLAAVPAMAGELRPWDSVAFVDAQAADRPVLIHVTAPWCPTCRAQKPSIQSLVSSPDHPDLLVLEVDFDSQKDVLRQFNARQQSTLIAFAGDSEVGRAVGVTDPYAIFALAEKTR